MGFGCLLKPVRWKYIYILYICYIENRTSAAFDSSPSLRDRLTFRLTNERTLNGPNYTSTKMDFLDNEQMIMHSTLISSYYCYKQQQQPEQQTTNDDSLL